MKKQESKYRWVVFASVLLSYLLIVSQRTAPGLITDQLMNDFEVTASAIGFMTSIQFLAYASLQIPIGVLSDRYGPNFFLIIGTLLNGIGTVIYSLAASESVLVIARLLVGMGDATIWVNLVIILSQWFKVNEFVRLLGLAGMIGSLGFLLATVPFSAWISSWGWRKPFFTVGIILCFCAILLYLVLVKNPKRMEKELSSHNTISEKRKPEREKTIHLLRKVFTDRLAWATFLCHFGVVGIYVGFIGSWAVPYGMQIYEMTRSDASQLIMIGLIGSIIGAPLTSWISSRLDSIKRPYMAVYLIVVLSWVTFLLYNGKPPFILLVILFFIIGFGNGASALTFAVVRKSLDMKVVGVISGFANTGGFLSAVLLPFIFGKILDHFHAAPANTAYYYGFFIPVLFSLMGLIGCMLIKERVKEPVKQREQTV